jgi:taurine dioxygenase
VIFFCDQTIWVDQQKDFGRRFGKLHIHPAAPKVLEQHPRDPCHQASAHA